MKLKALEKRFINTLNFCTRYIDIDDKILDLGTSNDFSIQLSEKGYKVANTKGEDLDLETDFQERYGKYDIITAIEILEHLLSPFVLLRNLPADRLIATVPLRLWFSKAYRNEEDSWDRHYHEFEDWQFDWLLEKAGWKIIESEKWTSPSSEIGIRPILRNFYPRYYAVYALRV
ncbi:MAG TPA: methyltransferase [Bacteroidales bacterium]|nr:methyltransferase [Bacteroidales bacterium]